MWTEFVHIHEKVWKLLDLNHSESPISKSSVSRIEAKYRKYDNIYDKILSRKPPLSVEVEINVLRSAQDLDVTNSLANDFHIGKSPVSKIFQKLTNILTKCTIQDTLIPDKKKQLPDLEEPNFVNRLVWFQHDGAPSHFTASFRLFLNVNFPTDA